MRRFFFWAHVFLSINEKICLSINEKIFLLGPSFFLSINEKNCLSINEIDKEIQRYIDR